MSRRTLVVESYRGGYPADAIDGANDLLREEDQVTEAEIAAARKRGPSRFNMSEADLQQMEAEIAAEEEAARQAMDMPA